MVYKVLLTARVGCKSGAFRNLISGHAFAIFFLGPGPDNPAGENLPEKEDVAGLRELGDTVACHLADMLQQLTAVNSAKPSERVAVRQGESGWGQSHRHWPSWITSVILMLLSEVRVPTDLNFYLEG